MEPDGQNNRKNGRRGFYHFIGYVLIGYDLFLYLTIIFGISTGEILEKKNVFVGDVLRLFRGSSKTRY